MAKNSKAIITRSTAATPVNNEPGENMKAIILILLLTACSREVIPYRRGGNLVVYNTGRPVNLTVKGYASCSLGKNEYMSTDIKPTYISVSNWGAPGYARFNVVPNEIVRIEPQDLIYTVKYKFTVVDQEPINTTQGYCR